MVSAVSQGNPVAHGLPTTFLVSADGAEVRRIDGPFNLASLERSVRALIQ